MLDGFEEKKTLKFTSERKNYYTRERMLIKSLMSDPQNDR